MHELKALPGLEFRRTAHPGMNTKDRFDRADVTVGSMLRTFVREIKTNVNDQKHFGQQIDAMCDRLARLSQLVDQTFNNEEL